MSLWLVTGGAGFIGSHLCDALVARGDSVRVLDDLSTGHRANLPDGVDLVVGDVADPAAAMHAAEGVDGCFHLAAIASVERCLKDWPGSHRANLSGTIAVFDAIRRHGSAVPVVYASSAAVYGDCDTMPLRETTPCRPLSAYGADKHGCELHARVASHVHGIPTVGLRFFNVYGPRQDPESPYSSVISIFCERIAKDLPIRVYGDGAQTRDFIHVSDVVAALLSAVLSRPDGAPVFNVCTGQATSVLGLADLIGNLTGRSPKINHLPPRSSEIRHSWGDRSSAKNSLGLTRTIDLRDGLKTILTEPDVAPRP